MSAPVLTLDPNAEKKRLVIEVLREYLAKAEAGELRSVHLCVFAAGERGMTRISAGDYDVLEAVGALEAAKHGLLANNMTGEE